MFSHVIFLLLLIHPILSLKCFVSLIPIVLNESLTIENIPSFENNTLVDDVDECTFVIMWLRNPLSTMIIFGYNEQLKKNEDLIDSIKSSVEYQLEGEVLSKRLSHRIEYKCQSTDQCNNGLYFTRVLKSFQIEETFVENFDNLLLSNDSFNNQSIENCYLERNTSDNCPSIDYSNCRRCESIVQYRSLSDVHICGTCPEQDSGFNWILREKFYVLTNRTEMFEQIHLACQNGQVCNSLENIQRIRQFSLIYLDFDKYFPPSPPPSSSSRIFFALIYPLIISFFMVFLY